jgi:NDP-sugar pyrophosphorylase family protein
MGDLAIVYIAAGISSRFLGRIKAFVKITDTETLIEYSLKQALPAGFTKIIFVVGKHTEQAFKEKFGTSYKGIPVSYAFQPFDETQRDKPWGTTDSLCSAKEIIDCPFVVCNSDDLYGENSFRILAEHLRNSNDCASLGFKLGAVTPEQGKTNRGIFQTDNENFITEIKEILGIERAEFGKYNVTEDSLCSMNTFALNPKALNELYGVVNEFKENHKGDRKSETLLPENVSQIIKQNKIKMKLYPTPDLWLGITNPGDEEIVREKLSRLSSY